MNGQLTSPVLTNLRLRSVLEVEPRCGFTSRAVSLSSTNTRNQAAMDFSSFSNELPKRRRTPLTRHQPSPTDPRRFSTTLSNQILSPDPVRTAYSRPHREKVMYEVTVVIGTNQRPIADVVMAASPGLARLAAQDKYGRHITVTGVKPLQQPRPKAS